MTIRQPIVTVCGHVDHGKTSILDSLRQSCVQKGEAGGITQKISFTSYPIEQMKKACPLIEKSGIKLNIPGFLFIDTPGHAAFTNLRKRGGSLADLAILVIDINEGIKPQTAEVIQILKHNKTPFIIALNKIDNISGWRAVSRDSLKTETSETGRMNGADIGIKDAVESQTINVRNNFQEKLFMLIGALNSYGFEADLFYNIEDFTKKVALVPCSAKTKQGLPEIIMMLCGVSQKYLEDKLKIGKQARGIILEVKKEKSISYAEAILHDGELSKTDEIAIASFGKPIITKIRILEEIQPLCTKFKPKDKVQASTGLRLQLISKDTQKGTSDVLPGMPFLIYKDNKEEIEKEFQKEISENIKTQKQGIIAKADSLGSLEALLTLLKESNISVVKAGIGSINKSDIISAKANMKSNEINAVVAGFNVSVDDDAKEIQGKIKVLKDKVIYKLIENLVEFRKEKANEIEKARLMKLTTICKLKILHQYVFRNSNPAVFGVRVEAGKLISNLSLIDDNNEKVGRVKNIQSDKKSVNEATQGMEVAISIPGSNFERKLQDKNILYSDISESQFKTFKKNKDLLSQDEIKILSEIADIKRKKKEDWGR